MRIRQEQVVFIGALALLALLFTGTLGGSRAVGGRGSTARAPEFDRHPAPDVARALPLERAPATNERSIFAPPRDTMPLPKLDFDAPPREPLAALRPPTAFGPLPERFGELLRVPAVVRVDPVEGLFQVEDALEQADAEAFDLSAGGELQAADRAAQIQSYLRSYDWIRMPGYHWGRIQNPDRFDLARREHEPILWVEFDPRTGQERFRGQPPISIARERLEKDDPFGFADTPENRIAIQRLEFRGQLTPGQYPRVLAFANACLDEHPGAENALSVAEEMFLKADQISAGDPAARLGLARCLEAAFEFERAYQIYSELIDGGRGEDPRVLARLAELLARFRLFDRAEELFRRAERFGRTQWEVQLAYGRFLLAQGRAEEAATHLDTAARFEPAEAERRDERADIRTDLATALFQQGEFAGAASWFRRALQAQADHQRALAGLRSVAYMQASSDLNGSTGLVEEGLIDARSSDYLLANGLLALGRGELARAEADLVLAAETDPLRAALAWRALSYLAEIAGYPEEALRYAEQAQEADPTDVYTLIQRGRILAARDDVEGALASFQAALDREMHLPDVLAAMGEIHFELGRYEDAERHLRGAIVLDGGVATVHTLRGLTQLAQGEVRAAEDSFKRALDLDRYDATAKCGLAWCAYLDGDTVEAQTLLRELDDARREFPEEEPYRAYARRQIARISDHEEKVVWRDNFERQQLMNDWQLEETAGPKGDIREGVMRFSGAFTNQGRARMKQRLNAADFVSFQAQLKLSPGSRVRVGLFVSLEQHVRGEYEVRSEVTLSRNPDGNVQTRFLRRGGDDLPYEDVLAEPWTTGEWVTLSIERSGESSDTRFQLSVAGVPVVSDIRVPSMGSTSGELWFGVFAEGEPGRSVELEIDDVRVVRRQR